MERNLELDDAFFYPSSTSSHFVKLSHLNTKSSVLCPDTQNITSQFLSLQQIDAHQQMVARAKSIVDTSPPKCLQSYLSAANQLKKRNWRKSPSNSKLSDREAHLDACQLLTQERMQQTFSDEDDASANAPSMNKGVQTSIPFTSFSSKTEDKISWYLEALSQGVLQSAPFTCTSRNPSRHSDTAPSSTRSGRRVPRGDILDLHRDEFVNVTRPFHPRVLRNPTAKSKVKEMRCYNPPFRKKDEDGSHSSDTFESYSQDGDSDAGDSEAHKSSTASSSAINEVPLNHVVEGSSSAAFQLDSVYYLNSRNNTKYFDGNEEYKYLNFLSKVMEDVLRSGIYSDRAIQQAFEFHMKFHQEETNKEKLQSLLQQVLDNLKISEDDPEDIPRRSNLTHMNFGRPSSPPEKDNLESLLMRDVGVKLDSGTGDEFNLRPYSLDQNLLLDVLPSPALNTDNLVPDES